MITLVASGSVCASLQSAGALGGFSLLATGGFALVGVAVGLAIVGGVYLHKRSTAEKEQPIVYCSGTPAKWKELMYDEEDLKNCTTEVVKLEEVIEDKL